MLSEAGKIAFDYAETIFHAGGELLDTFSNKTQVRRNILRIGAMATLSRNSGTPSVKAPLLFGGATGSRSSTWIASASTKCW